MEPHVNPPDEFWTSVVEHSPEGLVVVLAAIVAILFVLVKWGLPYFKEMRANDRELEKYKVNLEHERDGKYISALEKVAAAQERHTASQEQANRITEALATQSASLVALLQDSKGRSAAMQNIVDDTNDVVHDTSDTVHTMAIKIDEVHSIVKHNKGV